MMMIIILHPPINYPLLWILLPQHLFLITKPTFSLTLISLSMSLGIIFLRNQFHPLELNVKSQVQLTLEKYKLVSSLVSPLLGLSLFNLIFFMRLGFEVQLNLEKYKLASSLISPFLKLSFFTLIFLKYMRLGYH